MKIRPESFVRLVYPFLFDGELFAARRSQLDAATFDGSKRLWESASFPAAEVLPHVAQYLNPSAGVEPTACLWQVSADALQSLHGIGATHSVQWHLKTPSGKNIRLIIENVQLMLFRIGVGLLSIRVTFASEDPADWFDGIHYVRFLSREGVSLAARRHVRPATETDDGCTDFFPPLAGAPQAAGNERKFAELFDGLLRTLSQAGETDPWWQDVFIARQALPYIGLFCDDMAESEDAPTLYRLHNSFGADQQIDPAVEDLRLDQPHLLPYARRQWWLFSLDGGGLVVCQSPDTPFFRQTLPGHADGEYFLLFAVALHQRFALMGLSSAVAHYWTPRLDSVSEASELLREQAFRHIRALLLSFTARGYFAQVMQRRHHHRCYVGWQETFQIPRLFDEVNQEVRSIHEYLLMRKTAQVERLTTKLNMMVCITAPPALVVSTLNLMTAAGWQTAFGGLAIGLSVGLGLASALFYRHVMAAARSSKHYDRVMLAK